MSKRTILKPARRPGEYWDSYKARRAAANAYIKQALRGRLVWASQRRGTYRLAEHGPL